MTRRPLAVAAALGIAAIGVANGGYGATAWSWVALAGLWALVAALCLAGRLELPRSSLAGIVLLAALAAWTGLSALWSFRPPESLTELGRTLALVAWPMLVLLAGRSTRLPILVGLVAGLVAIEVFALALYLARPGFIDPTQGHLLFRPVGYANALGGLVAMTMPVLAAHALVVARPGLAASVLVPLAVALLLTQSRASWIALAVALAALLLRTRDSARVARLTSVMVMPTAASILVAVIGLPDAREGRTWRCAAALCIVAGSAAIAGVAANRVACVRFLERLHRTTLMTAACAAAVLSVVLWVRGGLGDRGAYWHVAWRMIRDAPLLGAGAGSFASKWLQLKSIDRSVLDAHSVYLETAAELGIVGLLLLLGVLLLPLLAMRDDRSATTTALFAGYVAFLVHAAFDWDWEMPVVALAGLGLGALLLAGRTTRSSLVVRGGSRVAVTAVVVLAIGFTVSSMIGRSLDSAATRALVHGDTVAAEAKARRAATFLPWASEPWEIAGDAALRRGESRRALAAYRTALRHDPNDWQSWLRVAAVARGTEAAQARARLLRLVPRPPA